MSSDEHLVVLIHGLNGYASDFDLLSAQLIDSGFTVYIPEQNHGKTSDGIAVGGSRLLDGVIQKINDFQATKISVIGHGLGGLFARYLVGLLFKAKIIPEMVMPMNYICINAPHLGSRADKLGFLGLLMDRTQKDLLLYNRGNKDPVLLEMVNNLFLSSLQLFKSHISYSPCRSERVQNVFPQDLGCEDKSKSHGFYSGLGAPSIDGFISKRLNMIKWKKISYLRGAALETNFWLSKPGVLVTNDILEKINHSHSISRSVSTRRRSIFNEYNQQKVHMVVLIHGLDGFSTDLGYISQKLFDRYQIPLYTYCPECNHYKTHDGILSGATRILTAIKKEMETRNIKFLSLIGHSLGGLYARCLVGLLFKENIIPGQVIPLNFITLASPHLGSREHGKMVGDRLVSFMGSIIGLTGKELTLSDATENGDPFLLNLAKGMFFDGLKLFKRLSVYSNIKYDVPVHYSTAAIRLRPFCTKTDINSLTLPAVINDDYPEIKSTIDKKIGNKLTFEGQIFERLNRLNWNRYAIIPSRPLLAHVDIIIKSEFWNHRHGFPVVSHLIDRFRHHDIEECSVISELKTTFSNEYLHLIVLVPGFDQVANDLLYLAETIRDKFPRPKYKITIPYCNNYKTKDGLVSLSLRLFETIKSEIKGTNISKISFISESSGGLIARYLVMLLFKAKIIPNVLKPMNFITVSTPHLGIKKQAFSLVKKSIIEQEMVLEDSNTLSIFNLMTTDEFIFPLSLFINRILYSNTRVDGSCTFCSSSITLEPSLSLNLNFVEDVYPRIFKFDYTIGTLTKSSESIKNPVYEASKMGFNSQIYAANIPNSDPSTTTLTDTSFLYLVNRLNSLQWKRFVIVPEKQLIQPARFSYWNEKYPLSIHIMENIVD